MKRNGKRKNQIWMAGLLRCLGLVFLLPKEVKAEEYYFNELINKVNIDNCVIDTDYKESNEVLENAIQRTLRFRG